jgi:dihydrofolate reductase
MTKLLYSATMSLDGFIAGPKGDMSWLLTHPAAPPSREVENVVNAVGAILMGNGTYNADDPNEGTANEGAFEGKWEGPQIVLTHNHTDLPADSAYIFKHDLNDAISAAKSHTSKEYVNVLGADIARQCITEGLLDEILVFIAPVLLGSGTPLFSALDHPYVSLKPLHTGNSASGLWYQVEY